jgi:hypothetical protein
MHSLAVFIDGVQSSADSLRIAKLPQDSCRLCLIIATVQRAQLLSGAACRASHCVGRNALKLLVQG